MTLQITQGTTVSSTSSMPRVPLPKWLWWRQRGMDEWGRSTVWTANRILAALLTCLLSWMEDARAWGRVQWLCLTSKWASCSPVHLTWLPTWRPTMSVLQVSVTWPLPSIFLSYIDLNLFLEWVSLTLSFVLFFIDFNWRINANFMEVYNS